MARTTTQLQDTQIKNAKVKEKSYTLSDGQGLQLLIKTDGTKLWEYRYNSPTLLKRRKTSFGTYPTIKLTDARDKRYKSQQLIKDGIDPIEHNQNVKLEKQLEKEKEKHTIGFVMNKYFKLEQHNKQLKDSTIALSKERLINHFISYLNKQELTPIIDIGYKETILSLEKLETQNKLETLSRVKRLIVNIFEYAYNESYIADIDFFYRLKLKRFKLNTSTKNNPTLTKKDDIKELYNKMQFYPKSLLTKYLLLFSIHTAQRQGSIIKAEWEHINFEDKVWVIPKENMKSTARKAKDHYVPLSDTVIDYLKDLKKISTSNKYIFPNSQINSKGNRNPHISNNTVTSALRTLGYTKEQQTAHGFRAMFKTICKENQEKHNLNNEFVERVLAHKVDGDVESAYNRANNIEDMRKVINWWSEWLKGLL